MIVFDFGKTKNELKVREFTRIRADMDSWQAKPEYAKALEFLKARVAAMIGVFRSLQSLEGMRKDFPRKARPLLKEAEAGSRSTKRLERNLREDLKYFKKTYLG